ncbi:hypothetical protein B0H10DRAFT_1967638 [Mycena sp. CBHHK59/15]|nr:hypothetical protein B0H10DRAFT_1967638 [Mycena sp. CBHHK59/15]
MLPAVLVQLHRVVTRHVSNLVYTPAKLETKGSATKKVATKVDWDKFAPVVAPEMPPSIVSMVNALAQVDRGVVPYTSNQADKHYFLPEPALFVTTTNPLRRRKFLHHWNLLSDGFIYMLAHHPQLLGQQDWRDILEGLITKCGAPDSRAYRRSKRLEQTLRPVLEACGLQSFEDFPITSECVPEFSLKQTREIIWQVAETSFRFEFCSLDQQASEKQRLSQVKECFAGHMLVGMPWDMSKCCWAAPTLEERHRYVMRTATLMLDWTTKLTRPNIIRGIAERHQWSLADMQTLETAICRHYTQAFWEHFGRAAVLLMRLDYDLEKEEGEL